MDFLLQHFRRLFSFLCGNSDNVRPKKPLDPDNTTRITVALAEAWPALQTLHLGNIICLSDADVSSAEEANMILQTHSNPHQVEEFILEGKPSIHSIPIQLFYFANLQRLSLCGNQLQDIPWSIIYLRQLKELDVSFNALSVLPRIVCYVPTLQLLSFRNNFITYLPTELLNLPNLKTLEVQDNPLVSPPPAIAERGRESILAYLRKRKSRRNMFSDFKPWISPNDNLVTVEVSTLVELCVKCILDCQIDFLGSRDIPPRLKTNLEETKKEDRNSIFICKCDVCEMYFSNKFKFEIHDCGNKLSVP